MQARISTEQMQMKEGKFTDTFHFFRQGPET